MTRRFVLAAFLIFVAVSCQRIQEPVPTPTADQWRRVQENLLTEMPTPAHPVGAVFDNQVRLIGWDMEPEEVEIGEEIALTLYWEVLAPVSHRWQMYVHLDSGASRQNLDHEAIGGLYPSPMWQPGQIIRDRVTATLSDANGQHDRRLHVGLFRGETRMPITTPGEGVVEGDGRLFVGSFDAKWNPPTYSIRRATVPVEIDGRPTDRAWARAQRTSNWGNPVSGAEVEGLNTWAKLLWDDEALYVLINARDNDIWATITERDGDLWDEEVVELYIDASGTGRYYLEIQVNPLNTVFDALFPAATDRNLALARGHDIDGLETAVYVSGTVDDRDDQDRSWTVEMRIPFRSIPGLEPSPPRPGQEIRVNFYRYDRPATGNVLTAAWSTVGGGSFHNPPRFGVATFDADPSELAPAAADIEVPEPAEAPTGVQPTPRRAPAPGR